MVRDRPSAPISTDARASVPSQSPELQHLNNAEAPDAYGQVATGQAQTASVEAARRHFQGPNGPQGHNPERVGTDSGVPAEQDFEIDYEAGQVETPATAAPAARTTPAPGSAPATTQTNVGATKPPLSMEDYKAEKAGLEDQVGWKIISGPFSPAVPFQPTSSTRFERSTGIQSTFSA